MTQPRKSSNELKNRSVETTQAEMQKEVGMGYKTEYARA